MTTNGKRQVRAPTFKWVRLGRMKVAPVGHGQREQKARRVNHLLADFDLDQFGVPVLSERQGDFYIIDGQHRIAALKRYLGDGWEDQQIQCEVYTDLTEREESDKFLRRNDTLNVSSMDKFSNAVTANYPDEVDVNSLVLAEGLCVTHEKVEGGVGAVATLLRVYRRAGPDTLAQTLHIIHLAYGDPGLEGLVIDGIGRLVHRYNGALGIVDVIERLGRARGGVGALLTRCEKLHAQFGSTKAECVAAAAVEVINARRGSKKIPNWFATPAPTPTA